MNIALNAKIMLLYVKIQNVHVTKDIKIVNIFKRSKSCTPI